ncbi:MULTISPECIES: hypothetical protein [Chitinophagaceae]
MNFYRVLRDNKELGPFSLEEIKKLGLKSSDLVWIDGQSAAWRFPDEVPGLLVHIESTSKAEGSVQDNEQSIVNKPKKRYRLTADHRMVEITEEEARSSHLPRIEEQPPAPKNERIAPPVEEKNKQSDFVPFENEPFSKRSAPKENDFPLEPELDSQAKKNVHTASDNEPFSKKRTETSLEETTSFPLEPELDSKPKESQPIEDFVDVDSEKNEDMAKESNAPSNTGAFILAGLLFLVAIGFFGYKAYKDQDVVAKETADKSTDSSTVADSLAAANTGNAHNGFVNSRSMAMNDDTLGQHERLAQRKAQDSIKQVELAKARLLAREKAKRDSIQNALAAQTAVDSPTSPTPTADKPKITTDTAKENKVNKIRTTEDIGKYVRVGVVQPKSQTNGVAGVKLVVHNINNKNLAKVHINVLYFDNNGNVIKKSDIIAPNITVGNSVTVPVTDNSSAAYVSYKVTGILGDHVNLQAK